MYESETASKKKTVLIASSDLSHYLSPEETERLDRQALDQVLHLSPVGLLNIVKSRDSDTHASLRRHYPDQVQRVSRQLPCRALSPPMTNTPSFNQT